MRTNLGLSRLAEMIASHRWKTLYVFDWPTDLEAPFKTALSQFEGERNVKYVTIIERLGREQDRVAGHWRT